MTDHETGRRLKDLRLKKKLSLRGLARASGVALSHLSLLEKGERSVTVATLKTILQAMGTRLGTFFNEEPQPPEKIVYAKGELKEITGQGNGISYKEVAAGRPGRMLQLILENYAPGADTGKEMYYHEAEEAGVVLKGKLELTVEDEVHVLNPGDAFYFDSRRPHRFRNIGKTKAQAISANTPPSF